jgi:hypothetical protein
MNRDDTFWRVVITLRRKDMIYGQFDVYHGPFTAKGTANACLNREVSAAQRDAEKSWQPAFVDARIEICTPYWEEA